MNKNELDRITSHESTWEEFERVEAIYMADERMTKEEAAKVWKVLYGEAARAREAAWNAPATAEELLLAIGTRSNGEVAVRNATYRFTRMDGGGYCRNPSIWRVDALGRMNIRTGAQDEKPFGLLYRTEGYSDKGSLVRSIA